MDLTAFKDALFARGASAGFSDMELYFQSTRQFSSNVFKGEVDKYTIAVEGGVSFRGSIGGRMGYAYTEKIDEASIDLLLAGAGASAEVVDSSESQPLYAGPFHYEAAEFFAGDLETVMPDQKIAFLKELEAECFRLDPRVTMVNFCSFGNVAGERLIANSRGLEQREKANNAFAHVSVVVKQGSDVKNAHKFKRSQHFSDFDAKALAREAVDEALSYLGAEPAESGTYPVLLRNTAAASLLATFSRIFSAENTQKGKSRLAGKVGLQVGSSVLTILDDPFLPGGPGSRTFDGEGVPTRRMALVEQGVLRGLLHSLKTAAVDGVASTGHGHRPSYKGAVTVAPSNLYVQPGSQTFDELVASVDVGVVVTSLQGLHSGANAISGDFSLAAHGYLIRGGKIVRAVNQITVAGNFYDLMAAVEAVGSDLEFPGGAVGSPTLKVARLAVTGK